jgi:hypothetical protein
MLKGFRPLLRLPLELLPDLKASPAARALAAAADLTAAAAARSASHRSTPCHCPKNTSTNGKIGAGIVLANRGNKIAQTHTILIKTTQKLHSK